ncbi:Translocator protein-like protein [Psilocybe cubensis]|uniref:Translocator protein-like protein n=2 Tax=Psilocybe cubensis TaxID=181762 RepID=A0ACB8H4Z2_PSICU|nr:Translocator protein-like protein [Psilocybe cubensis]KAH9482717.1 Translocator protein-like protein [Psilocybe cubensis]
MSIHIPNILLAIPRNPVTAVGLPLALGFFSGSHSSQVANSNWYAGLAAPPGRPRREVFPFAWTLLYVSMGYASHIAVKALDHTHLDVNRYIGLALIDSVLMTATTWYMTKLLDRPTDAKATYFLLPYCAWLGYATYLNAGTWWLNRQPKYRK